jgi:hypothetical protein
MLDEELGLLHDQNPVLESWLAENGGYLPEQDFINYQEGLLWGHKLLREASERSGQHLPPVDEDNINTFVVSVEERDQGMTMQQYARTKLQTIAQTDQAFVNGIRRITRFRTQRENFNTGALTVYGCFEAAVVASRMAEEFSELEDLGEV